MEIQEESTANCCWTDYPSWTAKKTKILHFCAKKLCSVSQRTGRDHPALDSSHVSYGFHSVLQYNGLWCCGVQMSLFMYYLWCRHRQHEKHMESVELNALKMVQKRQNTYTYNKDSMQQEQLTPQHHINRPCSWHHNTTLTGHTADTTTPH